MLIKAQNDNDFELIESLAREIWTEHYTPIIGRDQVNYMLEKFQSKNNIIKQIKKDQYSYYLIREDEDIFGYIAIQSKRDELFLSKFYVKSSHRGKGHGKHSILFIEGIAQKKGLNKISLTVNKNNLNTISAYEKMGFQKIGSIVQDIGKGYIMNDYIMEKNLH